MKKSAMCLVVLFSLSTSLVFAGPGSGDHSHGHAPSEPISKIKAGEKAAEFVKNFSKKGKLEKSWAMLQAASIEQKTFKKGPEWVVTFNNPKVENKDKQTLYVFLSLSGKFLGANFTGN